MNDPETPDHGDKDIRPITIEEEMKVSYLDYAMSVIVSRALPDVRDGLKPVHRRILYSMHENGYDWSKPYRKSARIVGDVMGKYHPHGDSSIYDALVRMAQDFSMRLVLIDGQGNFGSMDGDPPAAMRYTEARMAKPAGALLADIEKDTVDFADNYDGSESEPVVLPSRYPNLLVNGAGGIAVGMATNIPPHNIGEVVAATLAYLDNPDISVPELMEHIPGPDFPTGAQILGQGGIRQAYETGRGSVILRSKSHVEDVRKDRRALIVTEIPYQVNKSALIEKIADHVKEKRIEGIADLRDESDRHGVRIVIELKRDANEDVVLNQLYRHTQLQTSFGVNMLALDQGKPVQMGLKDVLKAFVDFRKQVITRRTKFELRKARERAHILAGLVIAVANIDRVVEIIRGSKSRAEAEETLMSEAFDGSEVKPYIDLIADPTGGLDDKDRYKLTERQVKAILDLRLHRLTQLGREEIGGELGDLAEKIEGYLAILRSREKLMAVMRGELEEVSQDFTDDRRTEIAGEVEGFEDEDLIQREDMVVTFTHSGYVKRVPLSTYRAQRRGGKGRAGMSTRDEDFLTAVFVASTHTPVLFFTSTGKVYKLKVWKLPLSTPQARGKAIINILPIEQDEWVTAILPLPEDEADWEGLNVMFATRSGYVRRNDMSDFTFVPSNGKIAIKFREDAPDDRLVGVQLCNEDDDCFLATRSGRAIRFPVTDVRQFKGRSSIGVRGVKLKKKDDRVIDMGILNGQRHTVEERAEYLKSAPWKQEPGKVTLSAKTMKELEEDEQFILSITENGYGKRTSSHEYRTMGRGGQGVVNIDTSKRNGKAVAAFTVEEGDELMLVTDQGKIIRTSADDVRVAGRGTQGVTIFRVGKDEKVVSVAKLQESDDEEEGEEGEETTEAESKTTNGKGEGEDAASPADD